MARRLLLISTSTIHGTGYLDHCAGPIQELLGSLRRVLFVPYALHDHDGYTAKARERYARMGYELTSVHEVEDPVAAVRATEALAQLLGMTGARIFRRGHPPLEVRSGEALYALLAGSA